jgi:hypothetical protein
MESFYNTFNNEKLVPFINKIVKLSVSVKNNDNLDIDDLKSLSVLNNLIDNFNNIVPDPICNNSDTESIDYSSSDDGSYKEGDEMVEQLTIHSLNKLNELNNGMLWYVTTALESDQESEISVIESISI